jgi:hypothetical protein
MTTKHTTQMISRLTDAGISFEDAWQLRRISMTLQRWFELECGDRNQYASWAIVRGRKINGVFEHDDDGKPFIERRIHTENKPRYESIADRENGAKRRLARIMQNYPTLSAYIQTDPRGASLYILPEGVTAENYNNGIAVYK